MEEERLLQKLSSRDAQIEQLRNENHALKTINQSLNHRMQKELESPNSSLANPLLKTNPVEVEKESKSLPRAISNEEEILYQVISNSVEGKLLSDSRRFVTMMHEKFPGGLLVDNAHYLLATLEYKLKSYPEALMRFDRIVTEFPHSERRGAALVGKAMTLRELGLKTEAITALQEVSLAYPGSREAQRASLELRSLQSKLQ